MLILYKCSGSHLWQFEEALLELLLEGNKLMISILMMIYLWTHYLVVSYEWYDLMLILESWGSLTIFEVAFWWLTFRYICSCLMSMMMFCNGVGIDSASSIIIPILDFVHIYMPLKLTLNALLHLFFWL